MSSETVEEPNSIGDNMPIPPRDNLVKTAAKFLSAPNVVNTPMDTKIAFLKKKGLSDPEIDLAIKQSEVIIQSRSFESRIPTTSLQTYIPPWPVQTRWTKFRDIANALTLLAGFAYAIYWFYKKYISHFFFGGKDKKSLDTRLSDIDKTVTKSMSELKTCITEIREDLEALSVKKGPTISMQIEELKGEVSSLKKLMLNSEYSGPILPVAELISKSKIRRPKKQRRKNLPP
ncbi:hypothetical protein O3M35_012020 [Rhynocoris fuscipes]|uniref:Peroxisomal membrane protein PEX14 n=1 Tax=Rhynocoris fuscipes TaxID=488301 RepID=A0AAW1CYB3_9HEMI